VSGGLKTEHHKKKAAFAVGRELLFLPGRIDIDRNFDYNIIELLAG